MLANLMFPSTSNTKISGQAGRLTDFAIQVSGYDHARLCRRF